jgi:uncharacterized protein (DUF952 family)
LVYGGADDVVILVIDRTKLPAAVRHEAAGPAAQEFPHSYGALPTDAVTGVLAVRRELAGRLVLPE